VEIRSSWKRTKISFDRVRLRSYVWGAVKKVLAVLCLVAAATGTPAATTNIGPWTPLFKGIEHTFVRVASTIPSEQQAINCLRIELTDPDISLFTTPHCTNCTRDTVNQNTSHFLETYGLQVAVNGNFYSPSDGNLGNPAEVFGLAISQGNLVSPQLLDDGEHSPMTVLLFTTNNGPTFIASNWPPVDTTGIDTAVGGNALLADGVDVAGNDDSDDPRTALGISQDKRYLFVMTVDGRNDGWSDGVTVFETAEWLAYFGAYNGVNLDGGGSTTMVMADCEGKAVRLNIPSYVLEQGRERRTGHNFGVYAKPLLSGIKDLAVKPGAVFGSALIMTQPGLVLPLLSIAMTGDLATLNWNGEGFTLQQTSDISSSNSWMDVPGPVNSSPAALTKTGTFFYRLRR